MSNDDLRGCAREDTIRYDRNSLTWTKKLNVITHQLNLAQYPDSRNKKIERRNYITDAVPAHLDRYIQVQDS